MRKKIKYILIFSITGIGVSAITAFSSWSLLYSVNSADTFEKVNKYRIAFTDENNSIIKEYTGLDKYSYIEVPHVENKKYVAVGLFTGWTLNNVLYSDWNDKTASVEEIAQHGSGNNIILKATFANYSTFNDNDKVLLNIRYEETTNYLYEIVNETSTFYMFNINPIFNVTTSGSLSGFKYYGTTDFSGDAVNKGFNDSIDLTTGKQHFIEAVYS